MLFLLLILAAPPPQTVKPVFILLNEQPHKRIVEDYARRGMGRRVAFPEIARTIAPSQAHIETLLREIGARNIIKYAAINLMSAEISDDAQATLASDPIVAEIFPVQIRRADLATSVPALGALAFWNNGWTGAGESVAVLDSGLALDHPAFAGKNIVSQVQLANGATNSMFADSTTSPTDLNGHGTHVAGIVVSQGSPGWETYQGVAKGIDTLYNVKIAFEGSDGFAYSDDRDAAAGLSWVFVNTAARIVNYSYGSTETADDDGLARVFDQLADTYGAVIAVAAGNAGSTAMTVGSPGIGYNILSVADWVSRGTIADSSSRGPTTGGRNKPDIAAPGTSIYSTAWNWASGTAFIPKTGTSMASPHIAGSAALLMSAGVATALEVRALLINTADSNPGWAADSGWGYANLNTTASQLTFHERNTLAARAFRLYRLTAPSGARATVTWNRHITGNTISNINNPLNRTSTSLNNIDLHAYDAASGSALATSNSTVQNVEQVSVTNTGDAIVSVHMTSTALGGGISSEPYGIAFSQAYTTATGPVLTASCSAPATVNKNVSFAVTCQVTNTGDLAAFAVTGTMSLPSGVSGGGQYVFGDVHPGTSSGQVAMNFTSTSVGSKTLNIILASTSYGESFVGTSAASLTILNPAVLAIAKSHSGTFTQGQASASYTVTVSNGASAGSTIGNVTVTENVPTGLTLISMSAASGWNCAANTCTESNVLAAGASYPAISVTVSVAATAPTSVVNSVTVSGGNSASATANDTTQIALAPYLVGDIAPATGTAVLTFGDGSVNTVDLLSLLRAVTGLPGYTPPCGSDLWDAMDVYPADTASARGGDHVLDTLDLITELQRISGIDSARPTRTSATYTCSQAQVQSRISARPAGYIEISGDAIYLHARVALSLGGLAMSLRGEHWTPTIPTSLVDTGIAGMLSLAWLDGMELRAGERVLLGRVTGSASVVKVVAHDKSTGRAVPLSARAALVKEVR